MRPLFLLVVLLSGCATTRGMVSWPDVKGDANDVTARVTQQGELVGFVESKGNHAWLGVPYAAPAQRWKAPRPPVKWEGRKQATQYGAQCPQINGPLGGAKAERGSVAGDEDCLTLSVFAPAMSADEARTAKRPVMLWIHGGGNTIGTGNVYGFARNLALKHGVIIVNVNYRLGVLGWFHHPALVDAAGTPEDNSGNYGTLDLIASLQWVRDNIEAFGGDAGNVTVFGESAGGFNTFSLLASPLARGLFHRAAIQSGVPGSVGLEAAWRATDDERPGVTGSSTEVLLAQLQLDGAKSRDDAKAKLAGMSADAIAAYLKQRTPSQLIAPFKSSSFGMYDAPALLRDGHVLPPGDVMTMLQSATVPVLLGTNRDEYKLFMVGNPQYVSRFLGLRIKDEVAYERDARFVTDVWRAIGVDAPVDALSRSGVGVYAYRFDWDDEPKRFFADVPKLLGAAHGLEIGFVFDDEDSEFDAFGVNTDENAAQRVKLARAMSSYWVQFARTGDPGQGVDGTLPKWEQPGDAHRFIVFDVEAKGGLRMDQGALTVDGVEEAMWKNPDFTSDPALCQRAKGVFKDFAGQVGAWTDERAQRFKERCP